MSVRAALSLCQANHSFLYVVRPDLFPQGFLTELELDLWARHYENKK